MEVMPGMVETQAPVAMVVMPEHQLLRPKMVSTRVLVLVAIKAEQGRQRQPRTTANTQALAGVLAAKVGLVAAHLRRQRRLLTADCTPGLVLAQEEISHKLRSLPPQSKHQLLPLLPLHNHQRASRLLDLVL
jgi:hypothetical protein